MTPSMQANIRRGFESSTRYQTGVQVEFKVLLISPNLESRRTISKVIEELAIRSFPARRCLRPGKRLSSNALI
jgi:hypothetical protein